MTKKPGKRPEQDREVALHAYILVRHAEYADWLKRRNAHRRELWQTAERQYPQQPVTMLPNRLLRLQRLEENAAMERRKKAWFNRQAKEWDKAHPTPLTWEKRRSSRRSSPRATSRLTGAD
jgi:hypothetical protein